MASSPNNRVDAAGGDHGKLGVLINGLGGAVATTVVAGVELLRLGAIDETGLPLARLDADLVRGLAGYRDLVFAGWDIYDADLLASARHHRVLPDALLDQVAAPLAALRPMPAVANVAFCPGVHDGRHVKQATTHAGALALVRDDIRRFRAEHNVERVVMLNLASVEASVDVSDPVYHDPQAFLAAVNANDPRVGPAMLGCLAALLEDVPYVNFTPSFAADLPALRAIAVERGVPVAGKDGKTGQTFVKTVLAPGFRDRNLEVEGWFSTNILGNRDGQALHDPRSLESKLQTKSGVLDSIMGKAVDNHVVHIHYYKPRGDAKEAWDNIDLVGFAGQPMCVKVNFLCRDSVLAAPLAIELVRLADYAQQLGEGGPMEFAGCFFKSPQRADGGAADHDFFHQQRALLDWLAARPAERPPAANGNGRRATPQPATAAR